MLGGGDVLSASFVLWFIETFSFSPQLPSLEALSIRTSGGLPTVGTLMVAAAAPFSIRTMIAWLPPFL